MKRAAFLCLLAAACARPMPVAPVPMMLASSLAPAAAVQRSASFLTGAGFVITTSDAAAGVLTATQDREATKMAPEITCYYGPDAIAAKGTRLTMTVSVSAAPAGPGSRVTLSSKVRQVEGATAGLTASMGTSSHADDACASTGDLERRLATAISTP